MSIARPLTHAFQISGYVSVLVPMRDGALTIRRCLEAIATQSYRPLEIIVIDDGSDDPSPAWVRSFRTAHPELPVVHLTQPAAGTGAALALGLAAARGEFIAFAHQADVWEPQKLASQLAALQQQPEAGYALGAVLERQGEGERRLAPARPSNGLLCERVSLSSLVARAGAIMDVGGIDPTPGLAAVHDLASRLARKHQAVRCDEVLAVCERPGAANDAEAVTASMARLAGLGKLDARQARQGQARAHAGFGWQALFAEEPRRARECFRQALAQDRWRLDAWLGLACARIDHTLFASGLLHPLSRAEAG